MFGLIISAAAGALMSLQGVLNTRLGEHVGRPEANALVQATAAALALVALLFRREGDFSALGQTPWYYCLGGVIAPAITLSVMLGMRALTPATAVCVILASQLISAGAVDALGLFGTERVPLTWTKALGAAMLIGGAVLFNRR